ncbi:hypothetical protein Pflav_047470 [Phytohabitans flavus]|uniref:Uncharacterized protein n=1 Tax=Phytohabitans flavus TaxID=1076124 RepID=A0A6F8XX15_9ACTN|nr:hypothetical protein [Phytohabitans flavus]BCB78337.1 hypothetical protein Pflav_047470 [Phytohabitans flavus]
MDENVRDLLAGVPAPPPTRSAADLAQVARRRIRRRNIERYALAGVMVAAVAVATPVAVANTRGTAPNGTPPAASPRAAAPITQCRLQKVALPPGLAEKGVQRVEPVGVDPSGRYVIARTWRDYSSPAAILWTDGRPEIVPVQGENVQPAAVNAGGLVMGIVYANGAWRSWVYRDGKVTQLPPPPGHPVDNMGLAVNAAGDVFGQADTPDVGTPDLVVWRAGNHYRPQILTPDEAAKVRAEFNNEGASAWLLTDEAGRVNTGKGTVAQLQTPPGVDWIQQTAVSGYWATGYGGLRAQREAQPGGTAARKLPYKVIRWDLRTGQGAVLGDHPVYDITGPARSPASPTRTSTPKATPSVPFSSTPPAANP